MLSFIKKLFSAGPSIDYLTLIQNGAQIIDVRTKAEYASGHIRGSVNIPLQELESNLKKINKEKPVITCCASGMRSASAKGILSSKGYDVYNGGGWAALRNVLG